MTRSGLLLIVASGAALASGAPASAQPSQPPLNATVSGAWMRVLTPDVPAGGYFTLRNTGRTPLVLTGARSPGCGTLMLHLSRDDGGMASMQSVARLPVAPGDTLTFAPGGYHLMCMQPAPTMHPGGSIPVDLQFENAGDLRATFAVRGVRGP